MECKYRTRKYVCYINFFSIFGLNVKSSESRKEGYFSVLWIKKKVCKYNTVPIEFFFQNYLLPIFVMKCVMIVEINILCYWFSTSSLARNFSGALHQCSRRRVCMYLCIFDGINFFFCCNCLKFHHIISLYSTILNYEYTISI
jgi:hypothetical protein